MYSFAFKTLFADRGKLLTGLAGVVFSLVLVNIQGGLFLGLIGKASLLIDHCEADLWVGHRQVENVDFPHDIPVAWLNRIRGLPGVNRVDEYVIGKGVATLGDGGFEDVWVVGSDPLSMLGSGWSFAEGSREDLKRPSGVSFDDTDVRKLGFPKVGDWLEVNGHKAKLVARTSGITGFVTTPYLFTTLDTARQLTGIPATNCSYLLVQADPSANRDQLQQAVREQLPHADVHQPRAFARASQDYWMKRTGIGVSFGGATLLGLLVGLVMVAQSLYSLALDHLSDYATLKALGAEDRHVFRVILLQALSIAGAGSLVGLSIVLAIRHSWSDPLAPIDMPPVLLSAAVGLVFTICLAASLLPYLRIRRVDPAVVLQG